MSTLKNELILLKQFYFFSCRHLRYFKIGLILYVIQFQLKKKAVALRAGFVFLQVIDDYLDGDRKCETEPALFVDSFLQRLRTNQLNRKNELDAIAQYYFKSIDSNPAKNEILNDVESLIETMLQDRHRLNGAFVWSANRLQAHHHRTFSLSMNISLATMQSRLRIDCMPTLLDVFAWCSTMRDLSEDLSKGICNIPIEVLSENQNSLILNREESSHFRVSPDLMTIDNVKNWIRRENKLASLNLEKCENELSLVPNESGKSLFSIFVKSMKSFHRKFSTSKKYSDFSLQVK